MKAHRHTAGNSGPDCTRSPGWPHPPLVGGEKTFPRRTTSKGTWGSLGSVFGRARPTRYPDSEFITAPPPSQTQGPVACFAAWRIVTRYSGATVPDSHGVPAASIVIQTSGAEERLASTRSKNPFQLGHMPGKAKGKLCLPHALPRPPSPNGVTNPHPDVTALIRSTFQSRHVFGRPFRAVQPGTTMRATQDTALGYTRVAPLGRVLNPDKTDSDSGP